MLTPAFELSQNDEFVTLMVKARYAKVSETEVFVDGKMVKFYSKPYFLRLTLPGALLEDGRESADYDADKGVFTIKIPKETQGEVFEGLDMLTRLMAPTGDVTAAEPAVELINSPEAADEREQSGDEEINWEVEQAPCLLDEDDVTGTVKYGFASRRSGVFSRLQDELTSIVDVPDPDRTKPSERRALRWQAEQDKFDEEHYLADLFQDEMVQPLLAFKPPWQDLVQEKDKTIASDLIKFTDDQQEQMRRLPRKEFLLDAAAEKEAYMGLVDILFAYAFDNRCTEGENSVLLLVDVIHRGEWNGQVESAWTICKLSSTLSWLDVFSSPCAAMIASVRRSLCYPLHRHWELGQAVCEDVKAICSLGRNQILKALLAVHRLLAEDDPHYILNELYITDYCVWIQGQSHQRIASLAESLNKVHIVKSDVSLDLEALEVAARCLLEEGEEEAGTGPAIEMKGYPQLLQGSGERDPSLLGEPLDLGVSPAASSTSKEQQRSEASRLEGGYRDSDDESSSLDESDTTEEESSTSEVTDTESDKSVGAGPCDEGEPHRKGTIAAKSGDQQADDAIEQEHQNGESDIVNAVSRLVVSSDGEKLEAEGEATSGTRMSSRKEENKGRNASDNQMRDTGMLIREEQAVLSVDPDRHGRPGGVCKEETMSDSLKQEKKCRQGKTDDSCESHSLLFQEEQSACSSSDLDNYCANIDSAGLRISREIVKLSKGTGDKRRTPRTLSKSGDTLAKKDTETGKEKKGKEGGLKESGIGRDTVGLGPSKKQPIHCQDQQGKSGGVGNVGVLSGKMALLMIEQSRNSTEEGVSSLDSDDDTA